MKTQVSLADFLENYLINENSVNYIAGYVKSTNYKISSVEDKRLRKEFKNAVKISNYEKAAMIISLYKECNLNSVVAKLLSSVYYYWFSKDTKTFINIKDIFKSLPKNDIEYFEYIWKVSLKFPYDFFETKNEVEYVLFLQRKLMSSILNGYGISTSTQYSTVFLEEYTKTNLKKELNEVNNLLIGFLSTYQPK